MERTSARAVCDMHPSSLSNDPHRVLARIGGEVCVTQEKMVKTLK